MILDRTESKIAEIQSYIELTEYNFIIRETVQNILDDGCKLFPYKLSNSKHQVTEHDCAIFLDIRDDRDRRHLLWDLFHEFGHHLDEDKLDKKDINNLDKLQKRERTAWMLADQQFIKYPELEIHTKNYRNYRNTCLESYKITDYTGVV